MPYTESKTKAKIREIRNSTEPVLNGFTNKLDHYEVEKEHFQWLLEQAEKVEKLQQQLDAKIMFVNNGMEEEQYVLQEKVIGYEKALGEIVNSPYGLRETMVKIAQKALKENKK